MDEKITLKISIGFLSNIGLVLLKKGALGWSTVCDKTFGIHACYADVSSRNGTKTVFLHIKLSLVNP